MLLNIVQGQKSVADPGPKAWFFLSVSRFWELLRCHAVYIHSESLHLTKAPWASGTEVPALP